MRERLVAIVGGGASGTLVALQLLRRIPAGVDVVVVEPREALGVGIAYSTPEPWHRINVPAATMSAFSDDPDDFVHWTGGARDDYPSRATWGRYLQARLTEAEAGAAGTLRHVRARATHLAAAPAGLAVATDVASVITADAVVVATGNELPRWPSFAAPALADPRLVRDPWGTNWLDEVEDGAVVGIVGTGHTALDVAESVLNTRPAARVVAISRRGDVPRSHEDPWRPRPSEPAFTVDEFRAFADPLVEARARIAAHPNGWVQGLDSIRPVTQALWASMDEPLRRRFVAEWRHDWEIHRGRFSPGMAREVQAFVDAGRLEIRAAAIERIVAASDGLRIEASGDDWRADRVILATGLNEAAAATPFLAESMALGTLRPGPLDLGLDADPVTLRAIDADGSTARPVWTIGPLIRGVVWETISIPEIRAEAVTIAEGIVEEIA